MPKSKNGKLIAPTQAIQSTIDNLLKYNHTLISAYQDKLQSKNSIRLEHPLKNVIKQLSAHNLRSAPSILEKAYCFGMHRYQLPNQFDRLGYNSQFVKDMPILRLAGKACLILQHGRSLAGYTSFIMLVPEINISIAVLVNFIGLSDPAGWINHLIIEAVIKTPEPNDYVKLAKEAANNHVTTVDRMWQRLTEIRKDIPAPRPLQDYMERYFSLTRDFFVEVKAKVKENNDTKLLLAFQGLDSQTRELNHWEDDASLTLTTFNDWVKHAIFTFGNENFFRFRFQANEAGHAEKMYWKLDTNVPTDDPFFFKEGMYKDSKSNGLS